MKVTGIAAIALVTGQLFALVPLCRYHLLEFGRANLVSSDGLSVLQPELLSMEFSDHLHGKNMTQEDGLRNHTTSPLWYQRHKHHKVAVAIMSSFDWQEQAPFVPFRDRRQLHRDTWMKHPAITEREDVAVYFVIGNQQHHRQGKDPKHTIDELDQERNHYGDIVLLDSSDMHSNGKNNAWYEWAALNVEADYHIKLDDESFVVVDRLLDALDEAPPRKFLGGVGHKMDARFGKRFGDLYQLPFLRGWGYIMSGDLIKGLGDCSSSKRVARNNGQHEDVYNALALQVCGLLDESVRYANGMQVHSLRHILSKGCPADAVDKAIVIHNGMRTASGSNPFPRVSGQTFHTLDKIYNNAQVGDLTPPMARWEGLRQLYMEDLGACKIHQGWTCEQGWEKRTCIAK